MSSLKPAWLDTLITRIACENSTGSRGFCAASNDAMDSNYVFNSSQYRDCTSSASTSNPLFILKTVSIFIPVIYAIYEIVSRVIINVMTALDDQLTHQIACILIHSNPDAKSVHDVIRYRGIFECNVKDLFKDRDGSMAAALQAAGALMDDDSPYQCIVPIPKKHAWKFLTVIEAQLNEVFSLGTLAFDMDLPYVEDMYSVTITLQSPRFAAEVSGETYRPEQKSLMNRLKLLMEHFTVMFCAAPAIEEQPNDDSHAAQGQKRRKVKQNTKTSYKYRIFVTKGSNLSDRSVIRKLEERFVREDSFSRQIHHEIDDLLASPLLKEGNSAIKAELDAKRKLAAGHDIAHQQRMALATLKEMQKYSLGGKELGVDHLVRPNIPIMTPLMEIATTPEDVLP